MALEDKEIFRVIYEKFADQPIEFIMTQYAKAKRMNMEIERLAHWDVTEPDSSEDEIITEAEVEEIELPRRKKLTKRSLIMDPSSSITEDAIYCCICGSKFQSLTKKHLAKHETTPEEYKKVCGFTPGTPLMSKNHYAASRKIIAKAQEGRRHNTSAE